MSSGSTATSARKSIREVRGRPEGAVLNFVAAVAGGYRSAAEGCFTRDACLLTPDGTLVHGRADIGAIIEQLTVARTEIDVGQLLYLTAGQVAFVTGSWSIATGASEGSRLVRTCEPVLVLHRAEFEWKIAIFGPWGIHGKNRFETPLTTQVR